MVKNFNFFFNFWHTVFWVTEYYCIKRTFWENAFFWPKNAFLWEKWHIDHLHSAAQHQCQGTFFLEGNFTPIFEAKKLRKVEEKCPGHFDSSQFSPKSAISGGFENKPFQKWLEPKTYCVCYPNTLLYKVLDHLWAKKSFPFFKNSHFWLF